MEYISKNIERKINFYECNNNIEELRVLYQSYLEYLMIYTLGYLWNKNIILPQNQTTCGAIN